MRPGRQATGIAFAGQAAASRQRRRPRTMRHSGPRGRPHTDYGLRETPDQSPPASRAADEERIGAASASPPGPRTPSAAPATQAHRPPRWRRNGESGCGPCADNSGALAAPPALACPQTLAHSCAIIGRGFCARRHGFQNVGRNLTALRGTIVTCRDDPFLTDPAKALAVETDGIVVCRNGLIEAVGPAAEIARALPADATVANYPGCIITPGFIDTHVHYVQTGMVASYGTQLLDWLDRYAFPAEIAFRTRRMPPQWRGLLRRAAAQRHHNRAGVLRGLSAIGRRPVRRGRKARHAHHRRQGADGPQRARGAARHRADRLRRLQGADRALAWPRRASLYAITPRFAGTSTPAQLDAAGSLWREHPDVFVHTHIAENRAEIAWTAKLFPESEELSRRLRSSRPDRAARGAGAWRASWRGRALPLPREPHGARALPDVEPVSRLRPVPHRRREEPASAGRGRAGHRHRRRHQLLAARHDGRGLRDRAAQRPFAQRDRGVLSRDARRRARARPGRPDRHDRARTRGRSRGARSKGDAAAVVAERARRVGRGSTLHADDARGRSRGARDLCGGTTRACAERDETR